MVLTGKKGSCQQIWLGYVRGSSFKEKYSIYHPGNEMEMLLLSKEALIQF